jgi:lipoprotein-anchoring transpeptidase ErfK/SrfK
MDIPHTLGTGRTMRFAMALPLVVLAAGAFTAPAAAGPVTLGVPLSNETTVTYWAHVAEAQAVRSAPKRAAAVVGRLRYETEDRLPEVYVALRTYVDPSGRPWFQVRLPARPNGRTGWVPGAALGPLRRVRTQLIIDRGRLRATLLRSGRPVWSARVGIGTPANPTPAGRFWVRERLHSTNAAYGPVAFGTSAYSTTLTDWPGGGVVGIHGTNQPQLIPGRPSHGCVRLRNEDILRLARLMPLGTPVLIR